MIIANISRIINLNGFKYNVWKCKMGDLYVKGCYLSVFAIDKPKIKHMENEIFFKHVCGYIQQ